MDSETDYQFVDLVEILVRRNPSTYMENSLGHGGGTRCPTCRSTGRHVSRLVAKRSQPHTASMLLPTTGGFIV